MNLKTSHASFAHEPTLNCPNCNDEIRLTESLAAPLIEETRRRFQEQLATKDAEVARNLDLVRKERGPRRSDRPGRRLALSSAGGPARARASQNREERSASVIPPTLAASLPTAQGRLRPDSASPKSDYTRPSTISA